jgi:hypothetical protein
VSRSAAKFDIPYTSVRPDVPDQPGDRARLIVQTAMLARAKLGDVAARKELLDLIQAGPAPPGKAAGRFLRQTQDPVLARIEAFNQLLAIEALATMGDAGRAVLRDIVTKSTDIVLRGYALEFLIRLGVNGDFVLKIADDAALPTVLRVQAVEGLVRKASRRKPALDVAESMVAAYLGEAGAQPGGRLGRRAASAEHFPSYACLSALKLLGTHRPQPLDTLLRVLRQAERNGDYERLVKSGARVGGRGGIDKVSLQAFPALYEVAVVELGRLDDPEAVDPLIKILEKIGGPGRPEAALALGHYRTRPAFDALLAALSAETPWLRYAAYRALREMTGANHFADWLFGSASERQRAIAAWTAWRDEKGTGRLAK